MMLVWIIRFAAYRITVGIQRCSCTRTSFRVDTRSARRGPASRRAAATIRFIPYAGYRRHHLHRVADEQPIVRIPETERINMHIKQFHVVKGR